MKATSTVRGHNQKKVITSEKVITGTYSSFGHNNISREKIQTKVHASDYGRYIESISNYRGGGEINEGQT